MLEIPTDDTLRLAHAHLEAWAQGALSVDEWLRVPPLDVVWHDVEGVPHVCIAIGSSPPLLVTYNGPDERMRAHGIVHLLAVLPASLGHHVGEVLGAYDDPECTTLAVVDALLTRALRDPADVKRFMDDLVLPSVHHWCAYHHDEANALGIQLRVQHGVGADDGLWHCRVDARDREAEVWGSSLLLVTRRAAGAQAIRTDATILFAGPATLRGRWQRWRAGQRCRRTMDIQLEGVLDIPRLVAAWWEGSEPLLRRQGTPSAQSAFSIL